MNNRQTVHLPIIDETNKKKLFEFYRQLDRIEQLRLDSRKEVMQKQFDRATGGKGLIVSNCK